MRDEIQTGNLAIDGAKNFGRFEAFFLPAARWEQVREAFWARTGFLVDPAAAVEQLRARLSDAFDRFLEGVADNRQVAFDDDGWRLKTAAAEQPDPAQSDRLAELPRWLDARSRSIRLADLLIEVENDLGFSVHFARAGREGPRLLNRESQATSSAAEHVLNLSVGFRPLPQTTRGCRRGTAVELRRRRGRT